MTNSKERHLPGIFISSTEEGLDKAPLPDLPSPQFPLWL